MISFILQTVAVCTAVLLVGYVPTSRMAGASSLGSMLAAGAVGLASSWIGAAPMILSRGSGAAAGANRMLMSMAVRMLVAIVLVLAIVLGTEVHRAVFLIWVAILYMALLIVDTRFALHATRGAYQGRGAS
jgi:hypothetical protein